MDELEVQEPPKKRRGWPKGKPRKPRIMEPPPQPFDEAPISVEGRLANGASFGFSCWDYSVDGNPWRFVSYPERRGRKLLRLLNPSEVADIQIEYPEYHKSQLEFQMPSSVTASAVTTTMPPPTAVVNPILARVREGRGTSAVPLSKPGEPPQSAVTEFDVQGNATHRVVGATMMGG